ncbi:hypothetical protein C2S51_023827 [Perilla frutescens var. frutescens]|nr:hypothetical protein C2S51_023827 [Perilla frutescens var. frutescens]
MIMQGPEAAVSFAVETLGNLLIQKAVFLRGVRGDVEWLRNELRRMQCFLKDAEKKQSESERIRNWISEIREVAHDAADAIEMFVLNVESRGKQGRCGATCLPGHAYHLNRVGKEIKSIRERLEDIERSRVNYSINQDLGHHQRLEYSSSQLQVESWRRLAYWQKDNDVVGLEQEVEELVEKLLRISTSAEKRRLGMGGIGKSTLASRIYHPAVVDRFECRAWVVVSNEFMLEDIMKQIMLQLGVSLDHLKLLESMSDELRRQEILQQELHKELKRKLYFIVLDDLWEPDHWESLRRAFPDDKASRLMVTSRNKDMSKYSDDYVHEMKLLDANRSWKLLLRKAFVDNGEGKCPEELKEVGEEILRKCSGLPLAISVVGGLLLKKTPCRSEWEKVANEMKYHFDSSRSSGGGIDTISTILELSYHNLIPELKACFLCLGFFKKDDIIKAKSLVHIWVAQDLVPQEVVAGKETMEDVARNYLNELISRNMVQVKESKYDQVKACHMHDLLRDLSLRKAKEEINFEVLREDGDQNSHQSSSREPRHRAVYSNQLNSIYSNRNQHVRSLFIYGEIEYTGDGPSSYWKCFELLRVLDLGNARFQVWPKTIGLLTGLRYFKMVYYGSISNLPRSWANLKNLEVLHLGCASELFITDQVILEMDGLRHLYAYITSCSNSKVPLGNLRNLQTLRWFVLEDSNIWQVSKMTGVCKLGFDMRRMLDASRLFTYLAKLENLFSLTLTYQVSKNMDGLQTLHRITQLKLVTMSLPGSFPPNLSHLTLTRMRLAEDPLPELERLPKLLYLKLRDAYVGQKMVISCHGFPSLKVFCLQDNVGVKNIETEKGAMPELKQLMIYNCRRLIIENLPEHLKSKIIDAD